MRDQTVLVINMRHKKCIFFPVNGHKNDVFRDSITMFITWDDNRIDNDHGIWAVWTMS